MRLFAPGAPVWFLTAQRSIEQAVGDPRVPECLEADLPDAEQYRGRLRLVTDLGSGMLAVSTGTDWIRIDTGAAL